MLTHRQRFLNQLNHVERVYKEIIRRKTGPEHKVQFLNLAIYMLDEARRRGRPNLDGVSIGKYERMKRKLRARERMLSQKIDSSEREAIEPCKNFIKVAFNDILSATDDPFGDEDEEVFRITIGGATAVDGWCECHGDKSAKKYKTNSDENSDWI